MNTQKQEQYAAEGLVVHSIFRTIQGEGPHAGRNAVFVRLAGCNLQCPWCDTDYTSKRMETDPTSLAIAAIGDGAVPLVVITGGEPLRQNIDGFVTELLRRGIEVQIETNGTYPLSDHLASVILHTSEPLTVVCSPKTPNVRIQPDLVALFKYVVDVDTPHEDGLPLATMGKGGTSRLWHPPKAIGRERIALQPADVGDPVLNENNTTDAAKRCLEHGYRLSIQIHKIAGLE